MIIFYQLLGYILIEAAVLSIVLRMIAKHEADFSFAKCAMVVAPMAMLPIILYGMLHKQISYETAKYLIPAILIPIAVMMVMQFCWTPLHKTVLAVAVLYGVHVSAGMIFDKVLGRFSFGGGAPKIGMSPLPIPQGGMPHPQAYMPPMPPPPQAYDRQRALARPTTTTKAAPEVPVDPALPLLKELHDWTEFRRTWTDQLTAVEHALSGSPMFEFRGVKLSRQVRGTAETYRLQVMASSKGRHYQETRKLSAALRGKRGTGAPTSANVRSYGRSKNPQAPKDEHLMTLECRYETAYFPPRRQYGKQETTLDVDALRQTARTSVAMPEPGKGYDQRIKRLVDRMLRAAGVTRKQISMAATPLKGAEYVQVYTVSLKAAWTYGELKKFLERFEKEHPLGRVTLIDLSVPDVKRRGALEVELQWLTWIDPAAAMQIVGQ